MQVRIIRCIHYSGGITTHGRLSMILEVSPSVYDHVKPPGRAGAVPADPSNRSSVPGVSGAAGPGPPQNTSKQPRKTPVLRDRALVSGAFGADAAEPGVCWELSDGSDHTPHSYLDAIRSGLEDSAVGVDPTDQTLARLCPFLEAGQCHYGQSCPYVHGEVCEVCDRRVLHPHDPEQRAEHHKMCMAAFERDMERAFAAQQSQDKQCKICLDVVYEKPSVSERRFGILSNCCHTYCLNCIRQWRCQHFHNQIRKSCPECRVVSEFVIPSMYWVEDQEEKDRLIEQFKSAVSKKPCKYFDQGRGTCPFGANCFYKHELPDGSRAEPEKPRKQLGAEGNVRFLNSVRLWDFIEEREQRSITHTEDEVNELGELFMQLSARADPH
ncbi:hypothetical protein DNTS_008284 [Danionella cerebrum]|uniref:E3 ubiquitin-protein ligase makorin-2 n=1 Tax=Danionella cerebrum TaxID=2873325 RepID=A0A553R6H7_9TELE|nr:hypothetical protein DNTS_008284 [Danionella translucida]